MVLRKLFKRNKSKYVPATKKLSYLIVACTVFLAVAIGAHVVIDLYSANYLQYQNAVCEFERASIVDKCSSAIVQSQIQLAKCSGELKACTNYIDFYHGCCKDCSEGKSSEYKTTNQLFKEKQ